MKRKFLAWLSRLRWRLVRKLGGEMPGDRVLVARSINPGLCRVEVNYGFMVCKMTDLCWMNVMQALCGKQCGIGSSGKWTRRGCCGMSYIGRAKTA